MADLTSNAEVAARQNKPRENFCIGARLARPIIMARKDTVSSTFSYRADNAFNA